MVAIQCALSRGALRRCVRMPHPVSDKEANEGTGGKPIRWPAQRWRRSGGGKRGWRQQRTSDSILQSTPAAMSSARHSGLPTTTTKQSAVRPPCAAAWETHVGGSAAGTVRRGGSSQWHRQRRKRGSLWGSGCGLWFRRIRCTIMCGAWRAQPQGHRQM